MSTFEGTLNERDKTHSAEMQLEREKREKLEGLVVTMQHNYQRRVEIGSETGDQPRPSAQPGELITGAGVGGAKRFEATTNFRSKTVTVEDTEMQDDPSVVDSMWQVRSGKGHSSDDSENPEFFIDENGEMNLIVSNLLLEINYTVSHLGRTIWHFPTNTLTLVTGTVVPVYPGPNSHITKSTGIPQAPKISNGVHQLFMLPPHV